MKRIIIAMATVIIALTPAVAAKPKNNLKPVSHIKVANALDLLRPVLCRSMASSATDLTSASRTG